MAGARRERSVRRHRHGCRPAVLKFDGITVQHVRKRPSSVALYSHGEVDKLVRAAVSIGVHRRCFHGCFQNGDEKSRSCRYAGTSLIADILSSSDYSGAESSQKAGRLRANRLERWRKSATGLSALAMRCRVRSGLNRLALPPTQGARQADTARPCAGDHGQQSAVRLPARLFRGR